MARSNAFDAHCCLAHEAKLVQARSTIDSQALRIKQLQDDLKGERSASLMMGFMLGVLVSVVAAVVFV